MNEFSYLGKIRKHSRANPFPGVDSGINPINRFMATFTIVTYFHQEKGSSLETPANFFKFDILMILAEVIKPLLM